MTENKVLLEYIWIDFDSNPRSKIKILEKSKFNKINIPEWNFDGSSTGQAEGKDSDVILHPCMSAVYPNPFVTYMEAYLVLCECYNKDGTMHETNHRVKLVETYSKCSEQEPIFGIEQEYVIFERENSKNNFRDTWRNWRRGWLRGCPGTSRSDESKIQPR
jgi:glutamine synthetase